MVVVMGMVMVMEMIVGMDMIVVLVVERLIVASIFISSYTATTTIIITTARWIEI